MIGNGTGCGTPPVGSNAAVDIPLIVLFPAFLVLRVSNGNGWSRSWGSGQGCEGGRGRRCIRLKTQGGRSGIGTKEGAHPHIFSAIVADSAAHPGTAAEGTHLLPPERGFSRQRWELRCRCRLKPALEFGHSGAVNPEGCRR